MFWECLVGASSSEPFRPCSSPIDHSCWLISNQFVSTSSSHLAFRCSREGRCCNEEWDGSHGQLHSSQQPGPADGGGCRRRGHGWRKRSCFIELMKQIKERRTHRGECQSHPWAVADRQSVTCLYAGLTLGMQIIVCS